ncbi:MAG TPA: flagellar filament capping protein FliD [Candidatus Ozemobacteraceae bacterium]|nr:flagellar filament capping protein FliD [Candidatus Ozemobacteraceae bacterium]
MVSNISRNWVGGLSSGLDTQSLITKIIEAERAPLNQLEQKRNTLGFQKSMLQDINLKLYGLQNKATDLIFSKTFNSKTVTSSSDKLLSAVANTSAKVGNYTINVKQLASATTVSSAGRLGGAIEMGENLRSSKSLGGPSTALSNLGITPGELKLTIGSATENITVDPNASVQNLINSINTAISGNGNMNGKAVAGYDLKTNRVRVTLLDSNKTLALADTTGNVVGKMFSATGNFTLTKDQPAKDSSLMAIRSGLQTTLRDLGVDPFSGMTIQRQGGPAVTLDLASAGLDENSTVSEFVSAMNRRIDASPDLVRGGAVTGNPADRRLEFKYDQGTGKLILANTDTTDVTKFTVGTSGGNLTAMLFGNTTVASTTDAGLKLYQETFSSIISSGTFTLDGVQISINNQSDTLQNVLSRITSLTGIAATYDPDKDTIRLTRKDGSSQPIGLGAANDTSNFLSVAGLISGSQATAATLASGSSLGFSAADALSQNLETLGLASPGTAGQVRLTVNGVASLVDWNSTDSLSSFMERLDAISGVESVWFDETTRTFRITSEQKGSSAGLKLEDMSGGLADALGIPSGMTATGSDTGPALESSRPLSSLQTSVTLDKAGFAQAITAGTFTINGTTFNISSPGSVTLESLMSTINNNKKAGVKAEFDAHTGKFMLTSTQTGNTSIAIGASTDTSNFLSALGMITAPQNVGKNAIFTVEGLYGGSDIVRQSNDVSDVISGLTFTLKGTTVGSGETITVAADTKNSRKAIDDFLASYNEVMELIYTKLKEEKDSSLQALTEVEKKALSTEELATYEEKFKIGLLAGDSTLSSIRSRMRVVMAGIVGGADKLFDSLSDIGITTGEVGSDYQTTQVGKLSITDEDKLNDVLTNNPEKLAALFANDSSSESNMGIARRLKNMLNEFTKSDGILTLRVGRSGVTNADSSMDRQITLLNKQINRQEEKLADREETLLKQFAALETAMSKYQSQADAFASQLSQLSGR